MHVCARVNTLQVESRWPKMNVAIEGGREKGIYACTFFMAAKQAERGTKHFICCCDIATYFIRRWKERKRKPNFFLTKAIVKIPSFAVFWFSKNFNGKNILLLASTVIFFWVFCIRADCNNVKAFCFNFTSELRKALTIFPKKVSQ